MAKSKKKPQHSGTITPKAAPAGYVDGFFRDEDGMLWGREQNWLEPEEALELVKSTGRWVVEWCGGKLETGDAGAPLPDYVPKHLLTSDMAARVRKKKSVPTVVVAELWRNDAFEDLVIFHESGPYPRA